MKRHLTSLILCVVSAGLSGAPVLRPVRPVVMMRFSSAQTRSLAEWKNTARVFAENPGCCDDVWFSTGESFPSVDWHRRHLVCLRQAVADMRAQGIGVSLQFEATIGHGDTFPTEAEKRIFDKDWTGWTGPDGTECRFVNCPRQPAFLRRVAEVGELYAELRPSVVWIDDDLRITNHAPVTGKDGPGCWCEKCVSDFSAGEGRSLTRESLHEAWLSDESLRERWYDFSARSMAEVACVIARSVRKTSPRTRIGLQTGADRNRMTVIVLNALAKAIGEKCSVRLGGSAYYDLSPIEQIGKSREMAANRLRMNVEDLVDNWCTEIESYPRAYGSRSVRSMAIEAFSSLGWGFDTASLFVMDRRSETDEFYARYLLSPLSRVSRFLNGYCEANRGTVPAGFTCQMSSCDGRNLMGIPLLPGFGTSWGAVLAERNGLSSVAAIWEGNFRRDRLLDFARAPSAALQEIRDQISATAPMEVLSPFAGVILPRVDEKGALRTIGLIGTRLDPQQDIEIRFSTQSHKAVWRELDADPQELSITEASGHRQCTIPSVSAWGIGYLELGAAKTNQETNQKEVL